MKVLQSFMNDSLLDRSENMKEDCKIEDNQMNQAHRLVWKDQDG